MNLTTRDLERCFQTVLKSVEEQGLLEIDSGANDFYWTILGGERLDFSTEPAPAVGSLDDDLLQLQRLAGGEISPSNVDLDRLAAVLRFLSDKLSS